MQLAVGLWHFLWDSRKKNKQWQMHAPYLCVCFFVFVLLSLLWPVEQTLCSQTSRCKKKKTTTPSEEQKTLFATRSYNIQPSSSSTNQNAALIIDHQLDFTEIRYWTMQTLRIVITLSHLRALLGALRETLLKVTNI